MRSLIAAVADHRDEISASVIELLLEASADQTGLTEVTEELRSSVIDEIMARASKEGILLIRSMKFDERGNTVGYQFHICS